MVKRPPVVAVLGHIDHGKSTLLDYIRKANTAEKEAGGITQHISAYEAEITVNDLPAQAGEKRRITFLDTPGHEAFCSVREQGAKAADIAILVISAEDSVKPQTLEALSCIQTEELPYIIALNKIDRPGANPDKVKQDLAEHSVLVEGWGGTIPLVKISAKTGEGVPELLEMISLQADLDELEGDPSVPAQGFVVESGLNPRQGVSATLIIKNGTLKLGMFVASSGAYAAVRAIEDYNGKNVPQASFSSPVRIFGWNAGPRAGSEFRAFSSKDEAAEFAGKSQDMETGQEAAKTESSAFFEVIVKTDTFGSLNAVEHELKKLANEKIAVKIISKEVGAVSEKDVKVANIKKTPIFGFNVGIDKNAAALAQRENLEVKTFDIIYELIDYVAQRVKAATPVETVEQIVGSAKILKTFSQNKDKQVVGGRMEEGELKSGASVKVFRREAEIGSGKVKELQVQKIKTASVKAGDEFGMMVESKIELVPGDVLRAIESVKM